MTAGFRPGRTDERAESFHTGFPDRVASQYRTLSSGSDATGSVGRAGLDATV